MGRNRNINVSYNQPRYVKPYTGVHLFWDVVLTLITGGFWLIVVLIQFLRRNSR